LAQYSRHHAESRPDKHELLVASGILLLATVLRAGWPKLTEFKFSEARLEALALELTQHGRLPLIGVPSSAGFDHSPISVYLYVPAFWATANPIPATVYGGLVGVAAVGICWWLARRWPGGGRWAALISGLVFAVSPWAVMFSRKIWQVAFVPLLSLAFVAYMVSALIEAPYRTKSRWGWLGDRRWHLAWALAIYALLVQVHPSAVSLALAIAVWLVIFRRHVKLGPLLVGGFLAALSAAPYLVHQFQNDWPVLVALGQLPESQVGPKSLVLGWETITGQGIHALAGRAYPLLKVVPALDPVFNVLGVATVAATIGLGWRMVADWPAKDPQRRQRARIDLVLLTWLLVPIFFNLRYSLDLHLHFFILIAPAAFFLIGRAAGWLFTAKILKLRTRRAVRIASLAALGLLATAQIIALVLMAQFVTSHDTPGGFGKPLANYLSEADEAVAIAEQAGAEEVLVVGQGDSPIVDETPAIFDVLFRERIDARFVDGPSTALFPAHNAVALLGPEAGQAGKWYRLWPVKQVSDDLQAIVLAGEWPERGFSPVPAPRTFENGIEIQGYLWSDPDPGEQHAQAWLLWQALWLDPDDTHFFVRWLGDGEQVLGQGDGVGYPTAYRRKGDRVISLFDITVEGQPATELSRLTSGVYRYPEVSNLPVIDESGNAVADSVVLGPARQDP
jgi:hypothetical protein